MNVSGHYQQVEKALKDAKSSIWWADLNLLAVVLIWGINLPIVKFALNDLDRFAFNAFRLCLSTVALGVFVAWRRLPCIDTTPGHLSLRKQIANIVWFALLTAFAYQVLFMLGIDGTSAGNTGVILSAIPMWIAVFSFWFLRERLAGQSWLGLVVAFAGVVTVTLAKPSLSTHGNTLSGNVLVSVAALCWAIGVVFSKPMLKNISPVALAFWSILITLPLHFLFVEDVIEQLNILRQSPMLIAALVYSGIFSTGFATAMWNIGVKQVGPSHAAGFQNLVPLIALLSSWALIGEVPFAFQLIGGVLIIAGLLLIRMGRR